ncbi:hypothetical protein HK100_007782 [Physocladia obscura]|uniref:Uncharacterized protein n=1 Tax=Physocladia obscura TaxID=109957 RepID=A0AAD5TA85_9FUNG|nr:hypothetical protein HK100_007782 [Physocladia obscura]
MSDVLALSAGLNALYVGARDGSLQVWNLGARKCVSVLTLNHESSESAEIPYTHPTPAEASTSSSIVDTIQRRASNLPGLTDILPTSISKTLFGDAASSGPASPKRKPSAVRTICTGSPDNPGQVFCAGDDGIIYEWDVKKGAVVREIDCSADGIGIGVLWIQYLADEEGERLFAATLDGCVRAFDLGSDKVSSGSDFSFFKQPQLPITNYKSPARITQELTRRASTPILNSVNSIIPSIGARISNLSDNHTSLQSTTTSAPQQQQQQLTDAAAITTAGATIATLRAQLDRANQLLSTQSQLTHRLKSELTVTRSHVATVKSELTARNAELAAAVRNNSSTKLRENLEDIIKRLEREAKAGRDAALLALEYITRQGSLIGVEIEVEVMGVMRLLESPWTPLNQSGLIEAMGGGGGGGKNGTRSGGFGGVKRCWDSDSEFDSEIDADGEYFDESDAWWRVDVLKIIQEQRALKAARIEEANRRAIMMWEKGMQGVGEGSTTSGDEGDNDDAEDTTEDEGGGRAAVAAASQRVKRAHRWSTMSLTRPVLAYHDAFTQQQYNFRRASIAAEIDSGSEDTEDEILQDPLSNNSNSNSNGNRNSLIFNSNPLMPGGSENAGGVGFSRGFLERIPEDDDFLHVSAAHPSQITGNETQNKHFFLEEDEENDDEAEQRLRRQSELFHNGDDIDDAVTTATASASVTAEHQLDMLLMTDLEEEEQQKQLVVDDDKNNNTENTGNNEEDNAIFELGLSVGKLDDSVVAAAAAANAARLNATRSKRAGLRQSIIYDSSRTWRTSPDESKIGRGTTAAVVDVHVHTIDDEDSEREVDFTVAAAAEIGTVAIAGDLSENEAIVGIENNDGELSSSESESDDNVVAAVEENLSQVQNFSDYDGYGDDSDPEYMTVSFGIDGSIQKFDEFGTLIPQTHSDDSGIDVLPKVDSTDDLQRPESRISRARPESRISRPDSRLMRPDSRIGRVVEDRSNSRLMWHQTKPVKEEEDDEAMDADTEGENKKTEKPAQNDSNERDLGVLNPELENGQLTETVENNHGAAEQQEENVAVEIADGVTKENDGQEDLESVVWKSPVKSSKEAASRASLILPVPTKGLSNENGQIDADLESVVWSGTVKSKKKAAAASQRGSLLFSADDPINGSHQGNNLDIDLQSVVWSGQVKSNKAAVAVGSLQQRDSFMLPPLPGAATAGIVDDDDDAESVIFKGPVKSKKNATVVVSHSQILEEPETDEIADAESIMWKGSVRSKKVSRKHAKSIGKVTAGNSDNNNSYKDDDVESIMWTGNVKSKKSTAKAARSIVGGGSGYGGAANGAGSLFDDGDEEEEFPVLENPESILWTGAVKSKKSTAKNAKSAKSGGGGGSLLGPLTSMGGGIIEDAESIVFRGAVRAQRPAVQQESIVDSNMIEDAESIVWHGSVKSKKSTTRKAKSVFSVADDGDSSVGGGGGVSNGGIMGQAPPLPPIEARMTLAVPDDDLARIMWQGSVKSTMKAVSADSEVLLEDLVPIPQTVTLETVEEERKQLLNGSTGVVANNEPKVFEPLGEPKGLGVVYFDENEPAAAAAAVDGFGDNAKIVVETATPIATSFFGGILKPIIQSPPATEGKQPPANQPKSRNPFSSWFTSSAEHELAIRNSTPIPQPVKEKSSSVSWFGAVDTVAEEKEEDDGENDHDSDLYLNSQTLANNVSVLSPNPNSVWFKEGATHVDDVVIVDELDTKPLKSSGGVKTTSTTQVKSKASTSWFSSALISEEPEKTEAQSIPKESPATPKPTAVAAVTAVAPTTSWFTPITSLIQAITDLVPDLEDTSNETSVFRIANEDEVVTLFDADIEGQLWVRADENQTTPGSRPGSVLRNRPLSVLRKRPESVLKRPLSALKERPMSALKGDGGSDDDDDENVVRDNRRSFRLAETATIEIDEKQISRLVESLSVADVKVNDKKPSKLAESFTASAEVDDEVYPSEVVEFSENRKSSFLEPIEVDIKEIPTSSEKRKSRRTDAIEPIAEVDEVEGIIQTDDTRKSRVEQFIASTSVISSSSAKFGSRRCKSLDARKSTSFVFDSSRRSQSVHVINKTLRTSIKPTFILGESPHDESTKRGSSSRPTSLIDSTVSESEASVSDSSSSIRSTSSTPFISDLEEKEGQPLAPSRRTSSSDLIKSPSTSRIKNRGSISSSLHSRPMSITPPPPPPPSQHAPVIGQASLQPVPTKPGHRRPSFKPANGSVDASLTPADKLALAFEQTLEAAIETPWLLVPKWLVIDEGEQPTSKATVV